MPRQWWTLYHDAPRDRLIETTLRANPQVGVADELPERRAGALADDIRTSSKAQ